MVNADRNENCVEMGAFAAKKHEQNGSLVPSLFSKHIDTGSRVYKLLINIEKIRPKPCPRSKKLAFLKEAKRLKQTRAVALSSSVDKPSVSFRKTAECTICNQVFQSVQSLYLHKKKQHSRICSVCNIEYSTKALCESHEKMHDSKDPNLIYKCHLCMKKFDSKENTRLHIRAMHTRIDSLIGKPETPTNTRDSSRTNVSHKKPIVQPIERLGELEYSKKIGEKSRKNDGRSMSNNSDVTFTCRVCSKDFTTVEAVEAHTFDHMEVVDEEYKCSICKKLLKCETSLNDHLAEHLSRALRCPVCPKAFINRATLRIHMKSHGQHWL